MVFDKLLKYENFQFEIDKRAVYSLLGYKKGETTISKEMATLLENSFKEAIELVDTKGVYIVRRIKEKKNGIRLFNSEIVLRGKSMEKLLYGSFGVIFMAVTIGPELERKISEDMENGSFERAIVFDVIGSEAVEAVANSFNSYLLIQARQAKNSLTRRFSPGYGDLPLEFQREIYRELSLSRLGIEINEKNILFPYKTITAIIGIER